MAEVRPAAGRRRAAGLLGAGRGRDGGDAAPARYRTPPPAVAEILTAPRLPRGAPEVAPDGARMVLLDTRPLIPIAVLAEPVEKLAGLEILPAYRCTRDQLKAASSGFSIVVVGGGEKVRAALPESARVGRIAWSRAGDRLACVLYARGGGELWIVEAASGVARRIDGVRLNTAVTDDLEWMRDGRSILCATLASGVGEPPRESRIPEGPEVRTGTGRVAPQRTARHVLTTEYEHRAFAYLTTAQLARVSLDGGMPHPIGPAASFFSWSVAPDEEHLAVEIDRAQPLGFPYYLFPRDLEIWDLDGQRVARVGGIPLNGRSAIASVARLGPRGWTWALDGRSLWFFSWQDAPGAKPFAAVKDTSLPQPGTDRLMRLDAPFTGEAREIAASDHRFVRMVWTTDGSRLLLVDRYSPRRRLRMWWIDAAGGGEHHLLVDRSTEGVYDDPGRPLTRRVLHSRVLWTSPDGERIYFAGDGFRPDGQRPFLDSRDLSSNETRRIYQGRDNVLEPVVALLSADGRRFLTLRQSNWIVPNYYVREAGEKLGKKVSDYADPAPALSSTRRIQFTFQRPDGVRLNAEAVLPQRWKKGQRLPTIFWVYPRDYRSAAAASENRRSPNRFPSQSPLNPEVLVTQGYAVVYPDLAVVGTNDRYVEEIRMSAKAALDEAVRMGFCDPRHVGVGGHSYGAFSTANLLAHTDLFKAGIASDGAYNRTLTPFTFQAEERTLWQARDTYVGMSPFMAADWIQAPLLLLHDLDDTNVGTNPIQSERMFEALNGMGKTVSLVEYPYEDHRPAARETVLDYWARVIEWFDRYVKGGGEGTPAERGQ